MELATTSESYSKNNNTNNKQPLEPTNAVEVHSQADEHVMPSSVVVGLLLEQVGKL